MKDNAQYLRKKLPPQMPIDGFSQQITSALVNAQEATKGFVIGNFLLNFMMSSSLNMLLSMINT
jgi:hypothetical protein